jgi:hypothetical protein
MLAALGKQVEFLPEGSVKSPDIRFDEQTWDIKYIDNANEKTIRTYIKEARKADNVLFYWDVFDKFSILQSAVRRSVGFFMSRNAIKTMPNVYYISKEKHLLNLWSK